MRFQSTSSAVALLGVSLCIRCLTLHECTFVSRQNNSYSHRLLSIFEMMATHEHSGAERRLLCSVASQITELDAAAIALTTDDPPLTIFCTSGIFARDMMDLEITVSEGPGTSTLRSDAMVMAPDLASDSAPQWMFYTPQALANGARSVFGFPIRIGMIRLGVLCLYGLRIGELSDQQISDALLMTTVIGRGVIALQAGAPSNTLSNELVKESTFDFSVHQAAGMVAVQAPMSIATALVALRMHAFSTSESLSSVALQVIARQLRFDGPRHEWVRDS